VSYGRQSRVVHWKTSSVVAIVSYKMTSSMVVVVYYCKPSSMVTIVACLVMSICIAP